MDASPGDGPSGNATVSYSGGSFQFEPRTRNRGQVRASSGGGLFTFWDANMGPNGFQSLEIEGGSLRSTYRPLSFYELVPGPDNRSIYSGLGLRFDPEGNRVVPPQNPQGPIPPVAIPSMDAAYYLMVAGLSGSRTPYQRSIRVSLHSANDGSRLLTMAELDEMDGIGIPNDFTNGDFTLDKRIHHIPAANLLITVPWTNDRVVLRRLEIEKALGEAPGNDLVITSPPTLFAASGKPFRHQIGTISSKGKPKYELSSGPDGLTVSPSGEIHWPNPTKSVVDRPIAEFKLSNPAGAERIYALRIVVK